MPPDIGLGIDMAPTSRGRAASKSDTGSRRRKTVHEGSRPSIHPHQPQHSQSQSQTLIAMRSSKAMDGLLLAEVGASMVEMDKLNANVTASKFREGKRIEPGELTPVQRGAPSTASVSRPMSEKKSSRARSRTDPVHGMSVHQGLSRHGTLLSSSTTSPVRCAEQLKVLLGDGSGKVKSGAAVVVSSSRSSRIASSKSASKTKSKSSESPESVAFEQGRSHARVALDLDLENNVAVEGGYISGTLLIRVRPKNKYDSLQLGGGKIRIAGFEVAPKNEDRCIFYQIGARLSDISNGCSGLYEMGVDKEGFGSVEEGEYSVRFSMQVPLVSTGGKPRGVLNARTGSGAAIKYIILASMKVVDPTTSKRSIAHFYRDCEIWPALDPPTILAPAPDPMLARAAKKLFMGGDGTLALTASLHRLTWIAGQPVHVRMRIMNETKKSVRSVCLVLVRTTTLFKVSAGMVAENELDDGETCTSERRVAEVVLTAGQKGAKGRASAKGWWTGVGPGETRSVVHSIMIPSDALSIPRARLVEVDYAVRVALCVSSIAGTSEAVHVTLPIRIVNFISLDPPPSGPVLPVSTSSVIELDTPRQESYPTPDSGMSGWEVVESPSYNGTFAHSQTRRVRNVKSDGNPSRQVRFKANNIPCNTALSNFPTAHTVHDLGSVEDADDLDDMFADIPGSTSILEEADITLDSTDLADSGYSEGGYSTTNNSGFSHCNRSRSSYTDEMYDEGESYENGGEGEDVGSDEELERMVGCASAQVDTGAFQHFADRSSSLRESGRGSCYSEGHYTTQVPSRSSMHKTGGTRAVRGPRDMKTGHQGRHERQATSTIAKHSQHSHGGVHEQYIDPGLPQAQSFKRTSSGMLFSTGVRSMLQVTNPTGTPVESPESMYSRTYAGSAIAMTSSPSKRLRSSPSKPATVIQSSQSTQVRPMASRASTLPMSVSTASKTGTGVKTANSVRARIAALEQRSYEEEEPSNDYAVLPGYVSRSLTTGAVHTHS